MSKIVCQHCGLEFKSELDLQTHQFNNRHCPDDSKGVCPECMALVAREELETFGGLCEECSGAFDD